ncbi:MAG: hypothetical protein JST48_00480 [Bacteroidetes bacterium]|nr:hypothetical protein [Bacteroidota bacterium]
MSTHLFIKTGRAFYGIGIIAYGVQQLVIGDFRPEIVPPFPAWAHTHAFFPIVSGIALLIAGVFITGVFRSKENIIPRVSFYLGMYFLFLLLFCHVVFCLLISPHSPMHLGVWAAALKELAYAGGALVVCGSFEGVSISKKNELWNSISKKLISAGRIFFSTTMILFGYSHFLYTDYVSPMVPSWIGMQVFWTYFGGTALIAAGICIVFKIYIKITASLLSLMIFLWFIVLHIPGAFANPTAGNGNEIVSAFDALLFSGVAMIIAQTLSTTRQSS